MIRNERSCIHGSLSDSPLETLERFEYVSVIAFVKAKRASEICPLRMTLLSAAKVSAM